MKIKNATMYQIIFFYALIMPIVSETWAPVEDIPIEFFQPEEYQESDIDHEILLRPSRTAASSLGQVDLKEQFFRSFGDENYPEADLDGRDLPRPGGFLSYQRQPDSPEGRIKRQILEEHPLATETIRINSDIEDALGTGPLELDTLNPPTLSTVSTESAPSTTDVISSEESSKSNLIIINDFLRFRRDVENEVEANKQHASQDNSKSENRSKRDHQNSPQPSKLSLENENDEMESNREPRGLTRQEWIKLPYQLQRSNEPYDDSSVAASDMIKAPRVHFITQRRSETIENPLVYRNERQGRDSDLPREARENMRGKEAFMPRLPRRYEPLPIYPQPHYDPRRDDFRGRYDDRNPVEDRRFPQPLPLPSYSGNRQRRIIYYANLPEITRSPPSVDFRERYRYRDAYDERYPIDPYRRKIYEKPRYDEADRNKAPYPLKVSTDVNVREVKKNPERRIYSEVDRKFGYNVPLNNNQEDTRH